jgi:catechol-2,3-dioxygenase
MDPLIAAVGHVAIRVRDLDLAVATATDLLRLKVSQQDGDRIYLTEGAPHHSLIYIEAEEDSLDHIGLVARDAEALAETRERATRAGFSVISEEPLNPATPEGFAIEGPEGFVYEVALGQDKLPPDSRPLGCLVTRIGHVNLFVKESRALAKFLEDVFDFRLSDELDGKGFFLRCNVDHHGMVAFPGDGVIHHYAWEVQSIAHLSDFADRVDQRGGSVLWGPGRHGIGNNIAIYFLEPCGIVTELYADMERIYDELTHEPGSWEMVGHKWFSLWAPQLPEGFLDLGIYPAALAKRAA